MNPRWMPSNVGAEPKKLALLAGLLILLGGVWWLNQPNQVAVSSAPIARPTPAIKSIPSPEIVPARRRLQSNNGGDDFRPSLKLAEGVEVSAIDPALHLDLLAKVRTMEATSTGGRSLFEFSQAPPPPPSVAPIKVGPVQVVEPAKSTPVTNVSEVPKTPPPPPITLKYYGFAGNSNGGQRRAFFWMGTTSLSPPRAK